MRDAKPVTAPETHGRVHWYNQSGCEGAGKKECGKNARAIWVMQTM